MRCSLDRRWATLAAAVLLGAGSGSLLGFVTAPGDGTAQELAPVERVVSSTTRRPRGHFAGVTSTTIRHRPPPLPAVTAGLRPTPTAATTSTARPTTTTAPPTATTRPVTTTVGDGTSTSSSSSSLPSSTTSTA